MNIRVHIERLLLDGLPVTRLDGPVVRAAVEAELARLLAERGLPRALRSPGAVPEAPGGSLTLGAARGPRQLGRQIGKAVYEGLSG